MRCGVVSVLRLDLFSPFPALSGHMGAVCYFECAAAIMVRGGSFPRTAVVNAHIYWYSFILVFHTRHHTISIHVRLLFSYFIKSLHSRRVDGKRRYSSSYIATYHRRRCT